MYFATDEEKRHLVNENGDIFTVDQFKTILTEGKGQVIQMTLMTQRLVSLDFDFDKLIEFYDAY